MMKPHLKKNLKNLEKEQVIQVNKKHNVEVRLPTIWGKYKLPPVEHSQDYNNWVSNPSMQFWQNQLNLAVWCATTGCGVSKEGHLQHKDPMIKEFVPVSCVLSN